MRTRGPLTGGLLLVMLAAALTGSASARTNRDDRVGAAPIDLATYNADRWIVQLAGKPLALPRRQARS
jgi:hypothetical protein